MAKRKKLNKRVVIILSVLGGIVALGVVAVVIARLPKDPVALAQKAEVKLQEGDESAAVRYLAAAAVEARRAGHELAPQYFYQLARTRIEWAFTDPELTQSARADQFARGWQALEEALRLDAEYVDAQRYLCDLVWARSNASGRWSEFIEQADRLIGLVPEDHLTLFRRGRAKAEMAATIGGEWVEKALADYRKAIELEPEAADYRQVLVGFLLQNDRRDEAEAALEEAVAAIPDSARIRILRAQYFRALGRDDEALAEIEEAIRVEPDSAAGYMELAAFHAAADDVDKAMAALMDAKRVDPTDPQVYVKEAVIHISRGQRDQAAAALREGLAVVARKAETLTDKDDEDVQRQRRGLSAARTELDYLLADVLLDTTGTEGVDVEAVMKEVTECLEQIKRVAPDGPQHDKIAGRIALREGNLNEAVRLLRRSHDGFLRSGRIDPKAATLLLRLYKLQGNPGEGDRIVDQILSIPAQRRHPPALLMKAKREIEYRRYESALKWLDEVLQIEPRNAEALELKKVLESAAGQVAVAPGTGEITDQSVRILLDRSQAMWLEEQRDQAVELLEELHRKTPDNVSIIAQLARMYVSQGRRDAGLKLLSDARARIGESEELDFEIARMAEPDPDKRFEMLLERIDKVLASDPSDAALAKARACALSGKPQRELSYLQEAERLTPGSAGVIQQTFDYAIRQENWSLAEEYAEKGAEANADGLNGAGIRIRLAQAKGEYDLAIDLLRELLDDSPQLKTAWVSLGDCYMVKGKFTLAESAYAEAERRDPVLPQAVIGLAQAAEKQGKWTEHEKWIRRAHQLPLARRHPYVRQAFLEYEEKNASNEEIVTKIIPKRERIAKQNPRDLVNKLQLAALYERTEQFGQAERAYRSLYESSPNKLEAAKLLAMFYVRSQNSTNVDKLFVDLLSATQEPAEKAKVWIAWGNCLQFYSVDQALVALEKAVEIDPDLPDAYLAKARYLARQRRWAEAAESMRGYLKFKPDDYDMAEKDLIMYMVEAGEIDQAAGRIDAILANDPADAEALTLKGIIAWKQRDLVKAESLFNRAIQMNPNSSLPLRYRTKLHIDRGEFVRAREDLQKARQLSAAPAVALELAAVHRRLGEYRQAEAVYNDVLKDDPRNQQAFEELIGLYLERRDWNRMESKLEAGKRLFPTSVLLRQYEAQMWRSRNDSAKQVDSYAKAFELAPRNKTVVVGYLTSLLEAGRYDDAIRIATKYQGEADWAPLMKAHRAAALAKTGQGAEAEKLFMDAITSADDIQLPAVLEKVQLAYGLVQGTQKLRGWADQGSGDWRIYYQLGKMCMGVDSDRPVPDFSGAASAYRKAMSLSNDPDVQVLINLDLGMVHAQTSQWREAEAAYLAVLEKRPDEMVALNNLAYIYVDQLDEPAKAEPLAKRAVDLHPGDHNVIDTYGWTLARLGKHDEAKRQLFRSLQMGAPMPDNRYHLGWVYEQTGQYGEALRQYDAAMQLVAPRAADDPLRKAVEEAIRRVRQETAQE